MTIDRAPRQGGPPEVSLGGLRVVVPSGWEVRIRRWAQSGDGDPMPVLHAATVPLLPGRGDFGSGVVEQLGPNDVFVGLLEFTSDNVDTALFPSRSELPRTVDSSMFHPKKLQRIIPGQAGQQVFFSYKKRAFCLYVVLGSAALRDRLLVRAEEILAGLTVSIEEESRNTSIPGRYEITAE